MSNTNIKNRILFSLEPHSMVESLCAELDAGKGKFDTRQFPDGESYLRVLSDVDKMHCIVLANISQPNEKYLPLIFLINTLRELGALSVGLIAPYLSYMRQDRRFVPGEAVTSKIFAHDLSTHIDWLVTVDPHLHRYHSLDEIYSIPNRVVQGAPALVDWLQSKKDILLIGPDAESEQWVSVIANQSHQDYIIGNKTRYGDRHVEISLPDVSLFSGRSAVIIDDVISSGQTILKCIEALKQKGFNDIQCASIHGIFADHSDRKLLQSGLTSLVTSNSIPHPSNKFDLTQLLVEPINHCLNKTKFSSKVEVNEGGKT